LVATVTSEEAVGGGERQRRRGGGGGGGGAVVHVRARRRPTITGSPPPLGEEFSDSPPLGEETVAEKIDLGTSPSRALSLSLSPAEKEVEELTNYCAPDSCNYPRTFMFLEN